VRARRPAAVGVTILPGGHRAARSDVPGPLALPIPADAIRWATTAGDSDVGRGRRAHAHLPDERGASVPSDQHGGTPAGARDALAGRLHPVVADAVAELGFDLETLDVQVAGRRKLVKVVVDADDGVGLDLLSGVSKAVSATLDAHDEILGGPYTLEVTSPGVDRPLTKPRHWRRAQLRLVRVRPHDGPEYTGRVGAADDTGVHLLVAGALRRVEYRTVARAAVEVEFRQPPAAELLMLAKTGRQDDQQDKDTEEESR
jgi:ribosome maturation factor RimP